MTTTDQPNTPPVAAVHPTFCEGGIPCERRQHLPADWTHRGRETTWHVMDTRFTLALVRHDGQNVRDGYRRGEVSAELTVTEKAFEDSDGNAISVTVTLSPDQLARFASFLEEYRSEVGWHADADKIYDMPASELPKERGQTKAQEVWNAIALGEELGMIRANGGEVSA
jgi:hypothetical protein